MASRGQLGYSCGSLKSINAGQISPLDKNTSFLDVSLGENHSIMLTDQLEVVSCGSNTYGQLGIGSFQDQSSASIFKVAQPIQMQGDQQNNQ